jgi:hypothetical protein
MFQMDVAHVLSGYCICFTLMLQVFHANVAYVLQWLHTCFPHVSDICCKCFNCFGHMLQMFPLDVEKVDLVLHMLQWAPFVVTVCMRVGVEGARAANAGNHMGADQDKSGRGTWSGVGHGAGMGHGAARDPT